MIKKLALTLRYLKTNLDAIKLTIPLQAARGYDKKLALTLRYLKTNLDAIQLTIPLQAARCHDKN